MNNSLWPEALPSGPKILPSGPSFLFQKRSYVFVAEKFYQLVLPVEHWESYSFLSFGPLFQPSLSIQCFCCYKSQKPCGSTMYIMEIHSIRPKTPPQVSPDELIITPGFCWDGQGDLWIICLISSESSLWLNILNFYPFQALAKSCRATPLAFFLEHNFPDSEPHFSIFCNLDRLRISQIMKSCSFLINSS